MSNLFNLFFESFACSDPNRLEEYNYCAHCNIDSGLFDRVCVLSDKGENYVGTTTIETGKRNTFNDFFELANKVTGPNDINVLCNSDITIDVTIRLLEKLTHEVAVGLSRWYPPTDYYFTNGYHQNGRSHPHSCDTWAWRGPCRVSNGNFPLGYTACDVRIMQCFVEARYRVYNPAKSIITWHHHRERPASLPPQVPGPYWADGMTEHHSLDDVI